MRKDGNDKRRARACNGLPALLDKDCRVVLLGTFPSEQSLATGQYYANPRNQFWRLIGAMLKEPLAEMSYDQRLSRLRAHGIGLWDIFKTCTREGSGDDQIERWTANDFRVLKKRCPHLATVAFNGKTAGRFDELLRQAGYRTVILPSSSSAHAAVSFTAKLIEWSALLS